MQFEVVYALPEKVYRVVVDAQPGVTAQQVYQRSGLESIVQPPIQLGIFGRKIEADYVMQRGERLELYRELIADPKLKRRRKVEARRQQASRGD